MAQTATTAQSVKPTAERILDAAERHFAEKGYTATSLGEIADDVGIRSPSLYKHFASKLALYEAVMHRLLDPYFQMLESVLAVPGDVEQAEQNLENVVRHYYATPNLARLVQHAALAGGDEVQLMMTEWFDPVFERAAALTHQTPFLSGSDSKQVLYLVMAFHNMMSGYVTMAPLHEKLLGEDPLGASARQHHIEFMKGIARVLWNAPALPAEPSPRGK
jgi:TetR/AcrR family transcriptional regulator